MDRRTYRGRTTGRPGCLACGGEGRVWDRPNAEHVPCGCATDSIQRPRPANAPRTRDELTMLARLAGLEVEA